MIRPATHLDIPRLVELGQMMHEESNYSGRIDFNKEKVESLFTTLVDGNTAGVVFVAEKANVINGGFVGGITEYWFSHEKVAFDYALFLTPESRNGITASRLVSAFVEWAKIREATEIQMGITTGVNVESTAKLYRFLGFDDAGLFFRREIN